MKILYCLISFVVATKATIIGTIQQEKYSVDVPVVLNVTNIGTEIEEFYPWELAMEKEGSLTANIFRITNEEAEFPYEVPYVGMLARRNITNEIEMVIIVPDQSILVNIELSMDYAFETVGTFQVKWRFGGVIGTIEINEALGDRRFGPNAVRDPTPLNCNNNEKSDISTTHKNAGIQIVNSLMYLDSGATSLFIEWFGTGSRSTVTSCWGKIQSRHGGSYRMQCDQSGCPRNTYAYVYPSDSTFTVYLCSVFWQVPNERAETLTHELSHFNSVCRTDDWIYGRSACRNLAKTHPNRAIDNADNYCYFGSDA